MKKWLKYRDPAKCSPFERMCACVYARGTYSDVIVWYMV